MVDTNYLRDALRAAGMEQVDTCRLCGALIYRPYQEAHNRVHQGEYEPLAADDPNTGVDACRLCGALIYRSYQGAHDRVHA